MSVCSGNSEDHCCHLAGQVCRFLEIDTIPGRKWVCGLRRELGSWESVHNNSRYLEHVRPFWNEFAPELNCGTWPRPNEKCGTCGIAG